MNLDTIRRRLSSQGPHVIRTSDGHEYAVPHPEFAHVGRYYVFLEEETGAADIIDPRHIVAIQKIPMPKGGHGGSRRAA